MKNKSEIDFQKRVERTSNKMPRCEFEKFTRTDSMQFYHCKKVIAEAAEEIGCSQEEFVDYLVAFWEAGKESQKAPSKKRRK